MKPSNSLIFFRKDIGELLLNNGINFVYDICTINTLKQGNYLNDKSEFVIKGDKEFYCSNLCEIKINVCEICTIMVYFENSNCFLNNFNQICCDIKSLNESAVNFKNQLEKFFKIFDLLIDYKPLYAVLKNDIRNLPFDKYFFGKNIPFPIIVLVEKSKKKRKANTKMHLFESEHLFPSFFAMLFSFSFLNWILLFNNVGLKNIIFLLVALATYFFLVYETYDSFFIKYKQDKAMLVIIELYIFAGTLIGLFGSFALSGGNTKNALFIVFCILSIVLSLCSIFIAKIFILVKKITIRRVEDK